MEAFVNAINTYGLFAVLVGVAVFLCYMFFKSRIEAREKREKQRLQIEAEDAAAKRERERDTAENERYNKLVDKVLEAINKGAIHTPKEQKEDRKLHELIQHNLDSLVTAGAIRAYYFVFHNGGRNVLGQSLLKMSITAESVARGDHIQIMARYQNIPRSMFTFGYKKLDEEGDYYILDVNNVESEDQASYNFLTEHGAKAALFRAAKSDDGLIIGFIGAEFDRTDIDFEEQKRNIARSASRIAGATIALNDELNLNN